MRRLGQRDYTLLATRLRKRKGDLSVIQEENVRIEGGEAQLASQMSDFSISASSAGAMVRKSINTRSLAMRTMIGGFH